MNYSHADRDHHVYGYRKKKCAPQDGSVDVLTHNGKRDQRRVDCKESGCYINDDRNDKEQSDRNTRDGVFHPVPKVFKLHLTAVDLLQVNTDDAANHCTKKD